MALSQAMLELGYSGGNMQAAIDTDAMHVAITAQLTGRATVMTPDVKALVCNLIAGGMTIEQIDRDPQYPSKGAINAARQLDVDFQGAITRARKIGAELKFESAADLVADVEFTAEDDQKFVSNRLRKAEVLGRVRIRQAEAYNPEQFAPKGNQTNIQINATSVESINLDAFRNW